MVPAIQDHYKNKILYIHTTVHNMGSYLNFMPVWGPCLPIQGFTGSPCICMQAVPFISIGKKRLHGHRRRHCFQFDICAGPRTHCVQGTSVKFYVTAFYRGSLNHTSRLCCSANRSQRKKKFSTHPSLKMQVFHFPVVKIVLVPIQVQNVRYEFLKILHLFFFCIILLSEACRKSM